MSPSPYMAPAAEGLYFPEVWVGINGGKNIRYPVPVNVNTGEYVMQSPITRDYQADCPRASIPGTASR